MEMKGQRREQWRIESRLRPHPFGRRTARMTPSLTVLMICDNGTVLWRHHRECISSNA